MQIKIPDIGDADSVEVIELCVSVGDEVSEEDALIVIESDKASMEVPAGAVGTVASILVALGDTVAAGDVIVTLETAAVAQPQEPDPPTAPADSAPEPAPASQMQVAPSAPIEVDISVPDVGDADGVEVVEVAVSVGDSVAEGDLLVILESDKASMEVPSDRDGTVLAVHTTVGETVSQDSLLVTLAVTAAAGASSPPAVPPPTVPPTAPPTTRQPAPAESAPSAASPALAETASSKTADSATVYAGPAVRRLARELGVDLHQVSGTGSNGRLVKEDVKAFVKQRLNDTGSASSGSGIPAVPTVDFSKFGPISTQPLGRTRELGATNLHRSWLNVVHVTQHDDADVTALEEFRQSLKAQGEAKGIKVTPLAFIIKACCAALQEFPTFNASLDAKVENFILKQYYHIGFAVDTPAGLVVPVIKDVDQKGIWDLSAEILEKAGKARDRKLAINDMQGGTFSVSSLGSIGGTGFTPIVNAPEVAILGVGRLAVKPQWNGSEFTPAKMLPLSLSYDHRAINGAEAGRFMQRLTVLLGDVRQLIL